MTKFNIENMEVYMQSYDVLRQKYFWDFEGDIPASLIEQVVLLERKHKASAEPWNYEKAQKAYRTVRKVYDDEIRNHLGILQVASEKFLGDFVSIEGIEQLFADSYFHFEWMMHLEYNPDKHEHINYRDHYIHQIKNMYEMLVLLDEYGYMDYCIESYQNNTNLIANQIKSGIEKQIQMADDQEWALFKDINEKMDKDKSEAEARKRMQEYCYRYLINAVSIVAALTHDIGYPVTFMLRTTEHLHSFLPLSEAFLHLNDAMPHLEEILQGSLLYRSVAPREIAKSIKDKKDHGAISAVILLSKYYETGAIYRLEPIERMVIELSAVVVYNHTLKYKYMGAKDELRYRNLFEENPISYLFRLCDDLQEWGRVYFDISKSSNFLVCPWCHMPISRDKVQSDKPPHISYSCACGISGVRRTQFPYRKLTNISACDALKIAGVNLPNVSGDKKRLKISMEYNLVSLLQLSLYNPAFAWQRADGVYEVKRMLDGQRTIPDVYIETFLTNNPVAIKVECLERYIRHIWGKHDIEGWYGQWKGNVLTANGSFNKGNASRKDYENLVDSICLVFDPVIVPEIVKCICKEEQWKDDDTNFLWNNIKNKWQQNLEFYCFLSLIGSIIEEYRKTGCLQDRNNAIIFSKQLTDAISRQYNIRDRITTILVMDYIWLRIRNVSDKEFFDHRARHYYEEASLSNESMKNVVEDYVQSDTYNKVKKELQKDHPQDLKGIYDFYTDYELFSAMAQCSEV